MAFLVVIQKSSTLRRKKKKRRWVQPKNDVRSGSRPSCDIRPMQRPEIRYDDKCNG